MKKHTIEYKFEILKEELVSQGFGPVKATSNGYRCYCPCHNDAGRPNLDISIIDKRILMHCKSCGANGLKVVGELKLNANILKEVIMSKKIDVEKKWRSGVKNSHAGKLEVFANKLNTSVEVLENYGCYYDIGLSSLCYPEYEYTHDMVGISCRKINGDKKALKGGNRGLCLPKTEKVKPHLFITEGASDCFALSRLLRSERNNKFQVIARPSKTTCFYCLILYIDRIKPKRVTICADIDDKAGISGQGAESLECDFLHMGYDANIIWPEDGSKDIREWIQNGATKDNFVRRDG